jgi:hypothetical protein
VNKTYFLALSLATIVLVAVGGAIAGSTGTAIRDVGALGELVVWISGLVKMVQLKRWGWFVAVLILAPLSTLLYGIYGPAQPRG